MDHAIAFVETGRLCLCTLHANNATQALDRIMHFSPPEHHSRLLMDLSLNLRAIVAQMLTPTPDGERRRACIEVLLDTPQAAHLDRKGAIHDDKQLMERSTAQGLQTFDQPLLDLHPPGEDTSRDALAHADSPNDLRLMIKLGSADADALGDTAAGLELERTEDDHPGMMLRP